MNPTGIVGRGWEGREEVHVGGLVLVHDGGEGRQHFWKTLAVPDWRAPVHGRADQVLDFRIGLTNPIEGLTNVLKHRINELGDRAGVWPIGVGDEASQARDYTCIGLRPDLAQSLLEDLQQAARQDLRPLDVLTGSTAGLVDVLPDVGIPEKREDSILGHRDEAGSLTTEQQDLGTEELRDDQFFKFSIFWFSATETMLAHDMIPCHSSFSLFFVLLCVVQLFFLCRLSGLSGNLKT